METSSYWRIIRCCTLCGRPDEPVSSFREINRERRDGQIIRELRIRYSLCRGCRNNGFPTRGKYLLPIDGSQPCDYCGRPAIEVSENQDVYLAARGRRLHYRCEACCELVKECFTRKREWMRENYPKTPRFPAHLIAEMDDEVRRIVAGG